MCRGVAPTRPDPPLAPRLATRAALALLILIWGTTWAAIRVGLTGIPPFAGVSLRFLIAGSFLLVLVPLVGARLGRSRRERVLWLVNALLSFSFSYGIVYWGEQYVPSGLAAVLFATFPLFVALLAHFVLPDERLDGPSVFGIVLGFAGVAVIFSEDLARLGGPEVGFAAAVMLLSPLVAAVANVAVKRWGQGIHPLSLTAIPMLLAGALMGVVSLVVERGRPLELTSAAVGALVYLALCGSAVTFTLYFWLLARLPATKLSLLTYAVPVVAVAVGVIALGEPLTGRVVAGSVLVIAGVSLAVRGRRRSRTAADVGS